MVARGDLCWLDLDPVVDHSPAKRRPVVVIQAEEFTRSALGTVIIAVCTSSLTAAAYPGNVLLPASVTGLPRDSVVTVTELATRDRAVLSEPIGRVPSYLMDDIDRGLRLVLAL